MVAPVNANPTLTLNVPAYDPSGHQINVAVHVTNISTDATTGSIYGDIAVSTTPSGTGSQAITVADGADISLGAKGDIKQTSSNGSGSVIALLKGIISYYNEGQNIADASMSVTAANDGTSTTAIAAGTSSNTVVKNAGNSTRLCRVLVTATGTNQMNIYDNASMNSGTIIGVIPANSSVGQVFEPKMPAANGITVGGNSNNPGVTISWT